MTDIWPLVHAERKALATDLEGLTEAQWSTPSLCSEWSVRDVLAHMTATSKITPGSFFAKFLKSGFSLKKLQASDVAAERGSSGADALARFKAQATSTKSPPGPKTTWLGETIVHAEDIRRSLGIAHRYPTEATKAVASFYTGSNAIIGAKKRVAGVTLRATDTDWSAGTGPEAAGPILSIIMAMTGRKAALGDLAGGGVATISARP